MALQRRRNPFPRGRLAPRTARARDAPTCHHGVVATSASRISARIAAITESATLAVDAKAKALQAAGEDVIGFGAGEPDFPTPAHIVEAADRGVPRPPQPPLLADAGPARAARGDRGQDQARLRRRRARAAQVLVTNGGKHAVYNAFQVLLDPGDEVLVPGAVLDDLPRGDHARRRRAGRRCRPPRPSGFRVTVEQLEAACTPRTKVLLFVSPSNPTGAVYPPDEVEAIGRWALERGIWVVTDEIYEHLTYGGHAFSSMPGARARARRPCVDRSTASPRPTR